jgi:hypothetical protein
MKLLSFRSVKLRRLRVSRHLLPVGRRELDQHLLDESDRQEAERAEIRMIHMMIVPSPNELHQRIDQVREEIDEVRRSIEQLNVDLNEEWQRREAVKARAKQFCKHISARESEYFAHIRRLRGIALEAGLWRFLRVNWTDDSRLSWAFAEVAKLEDVGQAERPPYLAFLNALFVEIGPDAIEGLKKETLKQEIGERWPPECGLPSDNLVDPMATILRSLKARRGGAKPQKKR